MGEKGTPLKPRPPAPPLPLARRLVWIVGQVFGKLTTVNDVKGYSEFEILGVFDDEGLASAACTKDNQFVGPMTMNERYPDERVAWPGAYYPILKETNEARDPSP